MWIYFIILYILKTKMKPKKKKKKLKQAFMTMIKTLPVHVNIFATTVHRPTNWATEGKQINLTYIIKYYAINFGEFFTTKLYVHLYVYTIIIFKPFVSCIKIILKFLH